MSFLRSMGIHFSSRSQSPPQPALQEKDVLRSKRRKSRSHSPRRPTVQEQLLQLQQGRQPIQIRQPEPPDPGRPQQPMYVRRQPSNQQLRPQVPIYTGVPRQRTSSFPPTVQPAVQPAPVAARTTWTGVPTVQPGAVPTVQPQPVIPQQNPPNGYINMQPLDRTDDNDPRLPPRPYPNSYWATPQLLASEYPSQGPTEVSFQRLDRLVSLGVVDFIDLTEPGELLPGEPYTLQLLPGIARRRGMGMIRMARMHEAHHRHRRSFSAGGVPVQVTGPQAVHIQQQPQMLAPEDTRGRGHNRYPSDPANHHRTGIIGDEGADWAIPVTRNTIRVAQYPIKDTTLPDPQTLSTILTALAHSQAQGRRAIVHCNGGYGRTGTIVGCWYVHSGVAQAAKVYYPGQLMQYRLPSGQIQWGPYIVKRSAGERALELLAKKWKGVERSRLPASRFTPGNQTQMDFVKAFKPPPPPVQQQAPAPVRPPQPLQRSRTGR